MSTPQPEKFKRCPNCQNFIPEIASVCQYCRAEQPGAVKAGRPEKKGPGLGRLLLYGLLGVFGCFVLAVIGSQFADGTRGASNGAEARPTFTPTGAVVQAVAADTPVPVAPTDIPIPTDTPVPTATPEPVVLSGVGQQASSVFRLGSGLAIARLTHSGQGHFGVRMLDASGQLVDLLANDIGPFDGSKAVQIRQAGDFVLDVSADGSWSVVMSQPVAVGAPQPPLVLSGVGQEASDFFALGDGLRRFVLRHDGQGHFGVRLLDASGQLVDLLANDIGPFDGSKAVGLRQAGVYLLDVSADGSWSVSIE